MHGTSCLLLGYAITKIPNLEIQLPTTAQFLFTFNITCHFYPLVSWIFKLSFHNLDLGGASEKVTMSVKFDEFEAAVTFVRKHLLYCFRPMLHAF